MINFKQALTDANTEYTYSTDVNELTAALTSVDGILAEKNLNESNRANGEALKMRLTCKVYLLEYLQSLDDGAAEKLLNYVAENKPIAEQKKYNKSGAVLSACAELVTALRLYDKSKREITALCNSEAALLHGGKQIIAQAQTLIDALSATDFTSPFGDNVSFPDLKQNLTQTLSDWRTGICGAYGKAIERSVSFKPLDYRKYDYFPVPEYDEGGKANVVILNTPFLDEARLYAANAIPKDVDIAEFDISSCDGKDGIERAFAFAEYKKCAVFFSHAELLAEGALRSFLRGAMTAGKSGAVIFIADLDGGALYDTAIEVAFADETLSALDVSASYITMPSFADTLSELTSLGYVSEAECREKLKQMPFLGFMGLNEITRPEHLRDCFTRGKKISAGNAAAAKRYLAKLKSAMLFIDGGWGDFYGGVKVADESGEFDYDGIADIDLSNIKRITESNATVFGQCGMLARYCTTGAGDISEWDKLDRAQIEERVTLAVNLVLRVLRVPVKPVVEVLDKIDNDGAGGTCYDGGKRIVFKYSCCRELAWMRDAIVHECFHALQAKLTSGNWTEWYYDNMGITYGRVCKWQQTRERKYNNNTKSDIYQVHMFEADAYAFEIDCRRGLEQYWNSVDFN